jgi:hypothetical protein
VAVWLCRERFWAGARPLWIPYYFCLVNTAAAIAVLSVLRGVRFETWEVAREARRPVALQATGSHGD